MIAHSITSWQRRKTFRSKVLKYQVWLYILCVQNIWDNSDNSVRFIVLRYSCILLGSLPIRFFYKTWWFCGSHIGCLRILCQSLEFRTPCARVSSGGGIESLVGRQMTGMWDVDLHMGNGPRSMLVWYMQVYITTLLLSPPPKFHVTLKCIRHAIYLLYSCLICISDNAVGFG